MYVCYDLSKKLSRMSKRQLIKPKKKIFGALKYRLPFILFGIRGFLINS